MVGTTKKMREAILAADSEKLGVRLGLFCLRYNIPAAHVAEQLNVSMPTVYSWFRGEVEPTRSIRDSVELLLLDPPFDDGKPEEPVQEKLEFE
jgi:hypothetical protein